MKQEEQVGRVVYYKDRRGNEPVKKFIDELAKKTDKHSRINLVKIRDYIRILSIHGKGAGEPYIKHIKNDIWELRPIKNRIIFAGWNENRFILLHHFVKKTGPTPREEINTALRRLEDAKMQQKEKERGK